MTNILINYSSAAVRIGRKNLLDEWKDSVRPLETIYYAKVTVKFDSNYVIRVSSVLTVSYTLPIISSTISITNNNQI